MRLFPAIDIRDGKCVRLYQGDYAEETVYDDDPIAQAKKFFDSGAESLHIVDLDAALTGEQTNLKVVKGICSEVGIPLQVGGGVRSFAQAMNLFEVGVNRVVIGTAAHSNPGLVKELADAGHSVAVGLDAKSGMLAVQGWTKETQQPISELAEQFSDSGAECFVVTDISSDGTLEGPNLGLLTQLLDVTDVDIIASGGVGSLKDLESLGDLESSNRTLSGIIIGKALYEKAFSLGEALAVFKS